ncbi:hypothetical protein UPYG_G00336330 [Umbra pygmaea]|uniref:Uncharacterized protein n=1 Tax=Umbra pygmaea TaxID=75934 RepID=A0ABD0W0H5_UMBPY
MWALPGGARQLLSPAGLERTSRLPTSLVPPSGKNGENLHTDYTHTATEPLIGSRNPPSSPSLRTTSKSTAKSSKDTAT